MRQGGDPRLPLELALIKATRPGADLERESLAFRIEQLERREGSRPAVDPEAPGLSAETSSPEPPPAAPPLELEQLQDAWQRAVIPAVEQRSIPTASVLREAHPSELAGDTLTVEFPATASFHRNLAEEPKHARPLVEALHEVTGRRFALAFVVDENGEPEQEEQRPLSEEELVEELKQTFDAREVTPE
jgi:hypothetical protein